MVVLVLIKLLFKSLLSAKSPDSSQTIQRIGQMREHRTSCDTFQAFDASSTGYVIFSQVIEENDENNCRYDNPIVNYRNHYYNAKQLNEDFDGVERSRRNHIVDETHVSGTPVKKDSDWVVIEERNRSSDHTLKQTIV